MLYSINMPDRVKALALPIAALCMIAIIAAYAAQASAEPGTSTEYAEYRNDRWHFSLAVPDDMIVSEHESGGVQMMTFTAATGTKQFEISVQPYSQLDLTLDRIGTPSGTTDQPDHLEIVNVARDDLFKVWFTKSGVLYVVVTLPEQEGWLTDILKTWQFTD